MVWFSSEGNIRISKKAAIHRAEIENQKIYVIRSSTFQYVLLGTKDVDLQKRLRVLGKDVDAIRLHRVADFVAYPDAKKKMQKGIPG